jgi:lysophospholipase L1-like esterase
VEVAVTPRVDRADAAVEATLGRAPGALSGAGSVRATAAPLTTAIGSLEGADRLAHFFGALAALDGGRSHDDVRVLQYGDSHTASDSGTSVVRRLLQARFGRGGRGFVSIGKPWKTYTQDAVSGGMTKEFAPEKPRFEEGRFWGDGCYGLLGVAIGAEAAGARAWTQVTAPTSRIEVEYWQHPAGGSFDVFIDGTRAGRIATQAAEPSGGSFAFDLPDVAHDVELRTVGDGSVRIFGMALDRAQAGVVVDALGINGAQIYTPLRWNEEHFAAQLRHRAPDLVVLAYGTNESLDSKLDVAEYERSLVELLGRVARAAPSASCLLLGPPDLARHGSTGFSGPWTTWPRVLEIAAVQQRVAKAAGCAFYDQIEAMGGPGSMIVWAAEAEPRASHDRVHLTRAGYTQVATSFATDLLRAYEAGRGRGDPPSNNAPTTWGVSR